MSAQALGWILQLAGLMVLAGCAAKSRRGPRPKLDTLTSVGNKPVAPKPRKKANPSAEVQEFMRLPPNVQRQVLNYARNWIDAHFERTG
jgi:hypothetical protein